MEYCSVFYNNTTDYFPYLMLEKIANLSFTELL